MGCSGSRLRARRERARRAHDVRRRRRRAHHRIRRSLRASLGPAAAAALLSASAVALLWRAARCTAALARQRCSGAAKRHRARQARVGRCRQWCLVRQQWTCPPPVALLEGMAQLVQRRLAGLDVHVRCARGGGAEELVFEPTGRWRRRWPAVRSRGRDCAGRGSIARVTANATTYGFSRRGVGSVKSVSKQVFVFAAPSASTLNESSRKAV